MEPPRLFADSSALIAAAHGDDPAHPRAARKFQRLASERARVLAGPVALAETHYFFLRTRDRETAHEVLLAVLDSPLFEAVSLGPATLRRALGLCRTTRLTTNDALVAQHAIDLGVPLLTLDADFRGVPGLSLEPW
ncbi:MAG: type II toxin-antitoxin system VapC family toxin [Halobacteria archaeon]